MQYFSAKIKKKSFKTQSYIDNQIKTCFAEIIDMQYVDATTNK